MKLTAYLLTAALVVACTDGGAGDDDDTAGADAAAGGVDADVLDGPTVVLETSMGNLVVRLAQTEMPITTGNFLDYVDAGFYDDTLIHRVVDDWVIQGGGYSTGLVPKSPNPPINLETSPRISHVHGAISMARTTDPDSATSQWFIVDWPDSGTPPQPGELDGQYAAFGVLVEGFDVLAGITAVETTTTGGLENVPVTEILVTSAHRR